MGCNYDCDCDCAGLGLLIFAFWGWALEMVVMGLCMVDGLCYWWCGWFETSTNLAWCGLVISVFVFFFRGEGGGCDCDT